MRILILSIALAGVAGQAHSALNDTGQSQCVDGGALAACNAANSGDLSPLPGQDGRFGRDAAAAAGMLGKTGGGAAGFDFTALDTTGSATTTGSHVCVRDNVTGLVWSTETLADTSWTDATSAAASYSRCGHATGWRLPSKRELLSIINFGTYNPAIDSGYFPETLSSWYWASESSQTNPAIALMVSTYGGDPGTAAKTDLNSAQLVFGAPVGIAAYTHNVDGTETDSVTGLIWDRCPYGQTGSDCSVGSGVYTWPHALAIAVAANATSYKGHRDWRLPNVKELESIILADAFHPALDAEAFPNAPFWYWSSTPHAGDPALAWAVNVDYGYASYGAQDTGLSVRLVRGGPPPAAFDALAPVIPADSAPVPTLSQLGATLLALLLAAAAGSSAARSIRR